MKRILKILARIYPAAWHQRYGTEFEALIEDRNPRLRDVFDILIEAMKMQFKTWSFIRIILACSILGALIAAALSLIVPPQYVSQTVLTVTGSATAPEEGLMPFLSRLRDITLDRSFLATLIQQKNLYPRERARMPLNQVVDKMLQSIAIKPASSEEPHALGFAVYFAYSDPHLAQQVENELVTRFVRENLMLMMNSAAAGHPISGETIRVKNEASLPQKPAGWNPIQKTTTGLLTGLLCGLILAATLRSRNNTTIANG